MTTDTHLDRLLGYLRHDPENRPLLLDATDAAINERKPDVAQSLLQRYEALDVLPPAGMNLEFRGQGIPGTVYILAVLDAPLPR